MPGKPRFIMCTCGGQCPGFAKIEVWPFINRARDQLDVEYAIVHPQLCVDDGDRFLKDIVKPDAVYVFGACDCRMQRKLFGQALEAAGVDVDKNVVFVELKGSTTEEAYEKVKAAVADALRGPGAEQLKEEG